MAAGALSAIAEGGFSVPEDISLVGFDDADPAPLLAAAHDGAAEQARRSAPRPVQH